MQHFPPTRVVAVTATVLVLLVPLCCTATGGGGDAADPPSEATWAALEQLVFGPRPLVPYSACCSACGPPSATCACWQQLSNETLSVLGRAFFPGLPLNRSFLAATALYDWTTCSFERLEPVTMLGSSGGGGALTPAQAVAAIFDSPVWAFVRGDDSTDAYGLPPNATADDFAAAWPGVANATRAEGAVLDYALSLLPPPVPAIAPAELWRGGPQLFAPDGDLVCAQFAETRGAFVGGEGTPTATTESATAVTVPLADCLQRLRDADVLHTTSYFTTTASRDELAGFDLGLRWRVLPQAAVAEAAVAADVPAAQQGPAWRQPREIAPFSIAQPTYEFLFPPGSEFRVVRVDGSSLEKGKGGINITLMEAAPGDTDAAAAGGRR